MKYFDLVGKRLVLCVGAVVLAAVLGPACSSGPGDSASTGSASGGGGDRSSSSSSSGSVSSGSISSGSTSSSGGGGGMQISGKAATELVNGGDTVKSPGYKMVFTVGQPTQNQGKTTSPGYRLQGGLVGANGSLP